MGKLTKREAEKLESGELVSVPARYLPLAKKITALEAALREARDTIEETGDRTTMNGYLVDKTLAAIDAVLGDGDRG